MRIFFSVGEPSGDLHGANLIRSLKQRDRDVVCCGYGGPKMAAAGFEQHEDLTQLAVMWIGGALWNLRRFWGLYQQARRYFQEQKPDAVVLIDYPGFNWWIAKAAKEHGVPVFYYGAPQLWAWAGWRVKKMRRYVDHVLCKLPFEETWYRERGCNAHYVGHPYFDELSDRRLDAETLAEWSVGEGSLVCLLPGSRKLEVRNNLPWMLKAAALVQEKLPSTRFVVASFNDEQAAMAKELVDEGEVAAPIRVNQTPELIEAADCCIACSGSVSLELLYHRKPAVIIYWVNRFMYWMVRNFFLKVRFVTLVNLLASESIAVQARPKPYDRHDPADQEVPYPEYPTCEDKSSELANHVLEWLQDENSRQESVSRLSRLRESVVRTGASQVAATYIMKTLTQTSPAATPRRVA